MAGFASDTDLTIALADRLKTAPGQLAAYYTSTIVPRANTAAWQEIQGRLLARGFSPAQIASWDRGAEFQIDLGVFFSIVYSGLYAGYDKETLKLLDRREELDKVQVFAGGTWLPPADSQGTSTQGTPCTAGNTFNWPNPEDNTPGSYTRW